MVRSESSVPVLPDPEVCDTVRSESWDCRVSIMSLCVEADKGALLSVLLEISAKGLISCGISPGSSLTSGKWNACCWAGETEIRGAGLEGVEELQLEVFELESGPCRDGMLMDGCEWDMGLPRRDAGNTSLKCEIPPRPGGLTPPSMLTFMIVSVNNSRYPGGNPQEGGTLGSHSR